MISSYTKLLFQFMIQVLKENHCILIFYRKNNFGFNISLKIVNKGIELLILRLKQFKFSEDILLLIN